MIKRIVILGHTGFIGSRIEKFFFGNYSSVEIVGKSFPDFNLVEDAGFLEDFFDLETAVIMCAAVKKQLGDSLENFEKNLIMVGNVCRVLAKCPVGRFIYFSSAAVYGESVQYDSITENTMIQPQTFYGAAKFASENILRKTVSQGLVILRPPVIYGPGDMAAYGPSGFVQSAFVNGEIVLWGDGSEMREFIFVDDLVAVVEKMLFSEYQGVLNVASGQSYSYQEILKCIEEKTKQSLRLRSKERTQPQVNHYFDNRQLLELLPGFRFTSLSEGVQKMIDVSQIVVSQEGIVQRGGV